MATFTILNPSQIDADYSSSSDDDGDDYDLQNFQMYKDRIEWSDIRPLKQNDGDHPVVSISYIPQYEDTFNYFRAILQKEEISERCLKLTEDCIRFNPTNYTVWYYRRLLLEKLPDINLIQELNYINRIIMKNPKNYQVWQHQKYLLKQIYEIISANDNNDDNRLPQLSREEFIDKFKQFINEILRRNDSKNYHAWQQRQWFIREYDSFENELDFIELMIDHDLRNNSAWNHRYFVIVNTTGFTDFDLFKRECHYTMEKNIMVPHNESSWNYLLGIVRINQNNYEKYSEIYDYLWNESEKLYESTKNSPKLSSYLVNFMYQMLLIRMDRLINENATTEQVNQLYEMAKDLLKQLAESIDTIRSQYWNYQLEKLITIYG